ncbi:MAG: glycoside hydrolase family 43 protein [Actinomycetota bacterium]|nr:glycoside hydrolase family 43 protein [Actinomycetota bacterium]
MESQRRRTPAPGGVRRRLLQVAIGVGAVVSVVAVSVGAGGSPHGGSATARASGTTLAHSGSPTPHAASLGLPALASSQVVEKDDVGDPFVLTVPPGANGNAHTSYVLYWTTDWQSNVPTAVSSDHVHWRRVADSLPVLPSWAVEETPSTMTWGPTVHRVGATWVLYFSTEDTATRLECLGRATSSSPTGPFTDTTSAPLVCQTALGGDIDPSVVTDGSGASALLWKNDGNATGAPVSIWEQPLAADGLSVTGSPARLLGADQAWEHNIVEGPAMLASSRGGWWLFYSGGTWQSNTYDTGVAWCATVAGPCRKTADAPLLSSTPTAVSPGGFDTFVDGHGKLWASYSAFPEAPADARAAMAENRVLEIAPVLSH